MSNYHKIMGELKDGTVILLFTWRGNPEDGVQRALLEANERQMQLERIWAEGA